MLFGNPTEKDFMLSGIVEDLAHYIQENQIEVIVVSGASAQPVALMLRETVARLKKDPQLRSLFSRFQMPYFFATGMINTRTKTTANEELQRKLTPLKKRINQRALILEEFMMTGNNMRKMQEALQQTGFKYIKKATLTLDPHNERLSKEVDFLGALGKQPTFDGLRRGAMQNYIDYRKQRQVANMILTAEQQKRLKNYRHPTKESRTTIRNTKH